VNNEASKLGVVVVLVSLCVFSGTGLARRIKTVKNTGWLLIGHRFETGF
jgi:hypothetical protein